jgi:sulfur carrier protein
MKIKLNGQDRELASVKTLNELVQNFCQQRTRIIAEVNGEIIKSPRWNETQINDGDVVELVSFVGGG